jgi:hypothetical protein
MPQFRDGQTRAKRVATMGRLDSAELATEMGSRIARRSTHIAPAVVGGPRSLRWQKSAVLIAQRAVRHA